MISVRNLEKHYGDVRAVSGLSFEVARGEIVGLLGHNGAGKTTVMKILTGYLEPTSGSVAVGGIDVIEDRVGVQRQMGYLPESAPSYPEMLVQEYLLMMAEYRGVAADARRDAVERAVRSTGLEDRLVRRIATLSKGYRQRVGLAQAILHEPDVLVLDEPTNGLDPVQILEIRGLIRRLAEDSTVILSTHILSEIEAVCSRVVILIDGNLATDAPLADLLSSDRVRLSLAAGTDGVAARLGKIAGVTAVASQGPDTSRPGFDLWSVSYEGDAAPTPEIAEAAAAAGWRLSAVAAETPSLEQFFRERMQAHVAQRRAAVSNEGDRAGRAA